MGYNSPFSDDYVIGVVGGERFKPFNLLLHKTIDNSLLSLARHLITKFGEIPPSRYRAVSTAQIVSLRFCLAEMEPCAFSSAGPSPLKAASNRRIAVERKGFQASCP